MRSSDWPNAFQAGGEVCGQAIGCIESIDSIDRVTKAILQTVGLGGPNLTRIGFPRPVLTVSTIIHGKAPTLAIKLANTSSLKDQLVR